MHKLLKRTATCGLILSSLGYSIASAQVIQYFGFQTDDPAALQFIQGNELQIGGALIAPHLTQDGSNTDAYGVTQTGSSNGDHPVDLAFPQLRYAHRFSPKLVAGLDVSEPVAGFYTFSQDSFASASGYDIGVRSVSLVPKISYALTDNLTLGAGFVATHIYNFDLNFQPSFSSGLGPFENQDMNGWGYGYQLGAMYKLNPQTYVDFTYISKISTEVEGNSSYQGNVSDDVHTNDFIWTPSTYDARLIRFMSQKWMTVGEVAYSQWGKEESIDLYHSAASPTSPIKTPLYYNDTWHFNWYNHYQFSDKWGGFFAISYDTNPQDDPDKNYTTLPVSAVTTPVIGGDYKINDNVKLAMYLGDGIWTPSPETHLPNSDVETSANWLFAGINLTVDWA